MDEPKKLIEDESEDAVLARIQEESLRYYNEVELPRRAAEGTQQMEESSEIEKSKSLDPEPQCSSKTVVDQATPVKDVFYQGTGCGTEGFHLAAGETYVYPTNYPIRKYQKNIVHSALFHNTLVSLPTGLGKTFIAAVVMYNYYRWFPQGKVVFMAPTRPLVAQQIRACHEIMAIPIRDTVEMTGTMNPIDRLQHWKTKRVFFLTPQVMANDLRSGVCPALLFKCVVIDEAHRATKEYSYCHVIKELENAGAIFRILALSATPGSNIKAVVEVVQNLRISTLELRGEDSSDVTPYTHSKQIEPVSLCLSKSITGFREQFLMIFERYAKSLRESRLITCNVQNLTKFQLLKTSEKMRLRPPSGMSKVKLGVLMSDFTVCMTLAHGLDLLQTYGLRAFHRYFTGCEDEENRKAAFTRLGQDVEFHQLMDNLHNVLMCPMDQFWSHPKHEHLVKILKEHFCQTEEGDDTKVIIFCQYRVVVSEINDLLQNIHPRIKPVMFIGQGLGKDKKGLPQKKQIEVMRQFREGKSNVLIATCVAEEGLDIGSVDLLILMEVQRSPVRLVQRLGRTGRHRKGRCVVLLTQGKEVQKFNEAMATRKSFLTTIQNSKVLAANLYKDEPSMIPSDLMPKIQLVHVNVPERITPGKTKKQSDIRHALMSKLNDTKEDVETPLLLPEQVALIKEDLNTLQINEDKLTFSKSNYLFHRINEAAMSSEEVFSSAFSQQSEYNDWNRLLQQTYLLSHSTDTEMLCHLLNKAETMQLGDHSDLNSQMSFNIINTNNNKISKTKVKSSFENITKKGKGEKEEKHGMDIRDCMAFAADKARFTQDKCVVRDDPVITQEPFILETVIDLESSPSLQYKQENVHPSSSKLNCSLCNHLIQGKGILLNKFVQPFSDQSFSFGLNQLEGFKIFSQLLTKELIDSIIIEDIFNADSGCTITNIKNNITNLKKSSIFSAFQNLADETIIDVNNIIENEFHTPPNSSSQSGLVSNSGEIRESTGNITKQLSQKSAVSKKNQDFFNLEDIFNEEDDDMFFHLVETSPKTSTPISKNKPVKMEISGKTFISEKNIGVNNFAAQDYTDKLSSSTKYTHLSSLNAKPVTCASNTIFKIPQLKLNFQTIRGPHVTNFISPVKPVSHGSPPILSGQISQNKSLVPAKLFSPRSPILSGQISQYNSLVPAKSFSPGSPILSGQISQNKPVFPAKSFSPRSSVLSGHISQNKSLVLDKSFSPGSPILSGQMSLPNKPSIPKLERKVLFFDEKFKINSSIDDSLLCTPLNNDIIDNHISPMVTEMEENMLSASQLFDEDSSEGNKIELLEQSSMYTISQMVAKVSMMANNQEFVNSVNVQSTVEKQYKERCTTVTNSDENSLLDNIDLDAFSSKVLCTSVNKTCANDDKHTLEQCLSNCSGGNRYTSSITISTQNMERNLLCSRNYVFNHLHNPKMSPRDDDYSKLASNDNSFSTSRNKNESNELTDLDTNNSIFQSPLATKNTVPVKQGNIAKKVKKKTLFVELEADVSGTPCSSDEENTSGLDDLDESFINDMTENPCTSVDQTVLDMQARYLQSVKSPARKPGGFKIPAVSNSALKRDVFSQDVEEDDDSYLNDSFCCDATEIPIDDAPSLLEIAEQILNKKRKSRKENRKKDKHTNLGPSTESKNLEISKGLNNKRLLGSDSSSDDGTVQLNRKFKRNRLYDSESSIDDIGGQLTCNKKTGKRKRHLSSDSSSEEKSIQIKKTLKRERRVHLLTSDSDSDSDRTA